MFHDFLKVSLSLIFLVIATFSFDILYIMASGASLRLSSRPRQFNSRWGWLSVGDISILFNIYKLTVVSLIECLVSSPGLKPSELLSSHGICRRSFVCLSSIRGNFHIFNLLLWNHRTKLNQTWLGWSILCQIFELIWSLLGGLSKLFVILPFSTNFRSQIENQMSDYGLMGASSFNVCLFHRNCYSTIIYGTYNWLCRVSQ